MTITNAERFNNTLSALADRGYPSTPGLPLEVRALEASLHKWIDGIVREDYTFLGSSANCACCNLWVAYPNFCDGCPIAERGNNSGCAGTPFEELSEALEDFYDAFGYTPEMEKAAMAEYHFLLDLLWEKAGLGEP